MKFGVREIADVVFKAKANMKIGTATFKAGQPVLYIDTATTSTLEQAATTVYAQGGRGNSRLIAWEGEKTLTFTVEDALLSPIGFAVLSGAGLFKAKDEQLVHVHATSSAVVDSDGTIDLTTALKGGESICAEAPIFVVEAEADNSITGEVIDGLSVNGNKLEGDTLKSKIGQAVFVDFYVTKKGSKVSELQIGAENFAGSYYVEASTLFREQATGKDLPAELTFPNVKIQSNMTFNLSASGDPSTFTFTMDAMPGYTYFDKTHKVLCVLQVVEDYSEAEKDIDSVMKHNEGEDIDNLNKINEENLNPHIFDDSVVTQPTSL